MSHLRLVQSHRASLVTVEGVDAELETFTSELVKQIEEHIRGTSSPFCMNRVLHRNDHLNETELLVQPSQ